MPRTILRCEILWLDVQLQRNEHLISCPEDLPQNVMNVLTKQCFESYLKNKEKLALQKEEHRVNAIQLALYYFEHHLPVLNERRLAEVGLHDVEIDHVRYMLCQGKKDQECFRFRAAGNEIQLFLIAKQIAVMLFQKISISHLVAEIITFIAFDNPRFVSL